MKSSFLDTFIEASVPTIVDFSKRFVPNKFPSIPQPCRIAIIGEAPGSDEVIAREPFVGMSGKLMNGLLSKAGIARETCFIGNVCQYQPPRNDFAAFAWTEDLIQQGIEQLKKDLSTFEPTLIICLGNASLHLFKEGNSAPPRHKKGTGHVYRWPNSISNWRGTIFESTFFRNIKTIGSYHPAACLREYSWRPVLTFDLARAKKESLIKGFVPPHRNLEINLSVDEICNRLEKIAVEKTKISIDIEGYVDSMSCIGIATSPTDAFIVPFANLNSSSFYDSTEQESRIWHSLAKVLADPTVPKILQNSLYDRFILQYCYRIVVAGTVDDTMLKHWEIFAELEKSLAFQTSIYTAEPFYKQDRHTDSRDTFFRYCCRDAAVTYEVSNCMDTILSDRASSRTHYQFNLDLLNPLLFMENEGIKYDTKRATERLVSINHFIYGLQFQLDSLAGVGIPNASPNDALMQLVRSKLCYKRNPSVPRKDYAADYYAISKYFPCESLSPNQLGHISVACGLSMNIKSKDFKDFLYRTLKLPVQRKENEYGEKVETTDEEALLKLQKSSPHPAVDLALQISSLRTRAQMLSISADKDGRVRCGYNVVGTETGRITCYTSPTGSGYNLQTIPSENLLQPMGHPLREGMRDLFVADNGYYLFQCDLSGADGWTVGAHLNALGQPTMLDDLRSKIKPAAAICFMLRHGNDSLNGKSREEIKDLLKEVKKEDWDYFACKQGIWGTCYLMGPDLLATVIAKRSEGKVWLTRPQVYAFQKAVFSRYNVEVWHRATEKMLANQPYPPSMTSPSGQIRKFFGRKEDRLGQALAHEPQANTTYATNLAMWKLWNDPSNRESGDLHDSPVNVDTRSQLQRRGIGSSTLSMPSTKLRIKPLHQIHDAILGQFSIVDTPWAVDRIKSYFANELVIAGQKITIPFEGVYGTNWAFNNESKKGVI